MEVHPFLKKLFVFLRSTVSCDINFLSFFILFFILVTLHQVLFFFVNLSLFYFYYSETIFFFVRHQSMLFLSSDPIDFIPFSSFIYVRVCVNYFVSFQMTPMLVELGRCHIFLVALLVCISDCLLMICVKNIKSMGRWYLNDS